MIERFLGDRRGATSIDNAMFAATIAIVLVAGATQIGTTLMRRPSRPSMPA